MAADDDTVRCSLRKLELSEGKKRRRMLHKMGVEKDNSRLALSSFLNYTLGHERHQAS
jgi:hypothetical protein